MKIEMNEKRPEHFKEYWPGQYDVFHHFEFACGIPSTLFAVTTLKENGQPNVSFNAWSSFGGESDGYYALLSGISRQSHTYKNIVRTGEFVVNFVSQAYFDACIATIAENGEDTDEITAGGFVRENSATVDCPRLKEAFLCLECKLTQDLSLTESGATALLIGKASHIVMEEEYATGIDGKYGDDGFMFNIHSPMNWKTGEGQASAVAVLNVTRVNDNG